MQQQILNLVYCYAPQDKWLRDELDHHLSILKHNKLIITWHNREILPGSDWKKETQAQINAAHIILLLISPDFLSSDYHYSVEMKQALEQHKNGSSHVLPLLVRPVLWEGSPLGELDVREHSKVGASNCVPCLLRTKYSREPQTGENQILLVLDDGSVSAPLSM